MLQAFLIISCVESCHCFDRADASFECTTCDKREQHCAWEVLIEVTVTLCARSLSLSLDLSAWIAAVML